MTLVRVTLPLLKLQDRYARVADDLGAERADLQVFVVPEEGLEPPTRGL
jgi:hypothetical protein